jgi:mannose-6-phosphate isomerase-like protein (cupin superfamily)
MQISIAHFRPHQSCETHRHIDLHEIFICEKGEIDVTVGSETVTIRPRDVLLVRPGNDHGLVNRTEELCELLIFGIACPVDVLA